jgi:hypothetical protein
LPTLQKLQYISEISWKNLVVLQSCGEGKDKRQSTFAEATVDEESKKTKV